MKPNIVFPIRKSSLPVEESEDYPNPRTPGGLTEFRRSAPACDYLSALGAIVDSLYPQQDQVATLLNVAKSSVSNWVKGTSIPSPDNFQRLAMHLAGIVPGGNPKLDAAIEEFYCMADKPVEEVAGHLKEKFKGARTVSDYYLTQSKDSAAILASYLPPRTKLALWVHVRQLTNLLLEQYGKNDTSDKHLAELLTRDCAMLSRA
jgi:transcriptional regulator with XRE-family HTH domain